MAKITKRSDRTAVKNPVANFDKFRDERRDHYNDLLLSYKFRFGTGKDGEGIEFKNDNGDVMLYEAPIFKEDREGLVDFLADADAYKAKYDNQIRHMTGAAQVTDLKKESESSLCDFLNEAASTLEHHELMGVNDPQDLYGKFLSIAAQQKINTKSFGQLWRDAQKNSKKGRDARAQLIQLAGYDIENKLISNSMEYHTKHLSLDEVDPERIDSYKALVGQLARVVSGGQYAPDLQTGILTLDDAKKEIAGKIIPGYIHNKEFIHNKNPDTATYHMEKPVDIKDKDGKLLKLEDFVKLRKSDDYTKKVNEPAGKREYKYMSDAA